MTRRRWTRLARLNQVYEGFVWQYGVIHDPRNQRLFGDLPELQFLVALERNPRRTPSGRWLADRERIFRERTLRPHQPALPGTLTPTEALLRCLDERGVLDTGYIATLAGQSPDAVVEALGERVYRLPGTSQYEIADIYLSGDVVAKLRDAPAWAERDPAFTRNVMALEAVQPVLRWPHQEPAENLGAPRTHLPPAPWPRPAPRRGAWAWLGWARLGGEYDAGAPPGPADRRQGDCERVHQDRRRSAHSPLKSTISVLVLEGDGYVEHGVYHRGEQAISKLLDGFTVSVDDVLDAK